MNEETTKLVHTLRRIMVTLAHPKSHSEHYAFLEAWQTLKDLGFDIPSDHERAIKHRGAWDRHLDEMEEDRRNTMERLRKDAHLVAVLKSKRKES